MKRFLSLVLAMLIAITMLIIPASAENYATAVVKGGWLRLRAEASASSETISAYFTGTQVTIIAPFAGVIHSVAMPVLTST